MVNPRFLYGNLASGATASASAGTASGYDVSNVVALDRATAWKGVGTASQRLILSIGSAITPTGIAIAAGNYSKWGATVNLQYSDDGAAWSTLHALSGYGALTDYTQDYFSKVTGASAHAYWALQFTTLTAAAELSIFYLATLATHADSYVYPHRQGPVFNVDAQTAEGRAINAERVARTIYDFVLDFNVGTAAGAAAMQAILEGEGGPLRPFFFVPVDETGSNDYGRAYLVRYTPSMFIPDRIFYGVSSYRVPLREEV